MASERGSYRRILVTACGSGGGLGLRRGRIADHLDPISEPDTLDQFWQLVVAVVMELSYRRHRFPPAVIQHAVWLYCASRSATETSRGIVNLTRSSRPSWPLSLERGQPYRRAKDFSAPNRRATDGRRIPPLLKLTMRAPGDRQGVESASLFQ
jgi:hypothetical protein